MSNQWFHRLLIAIAIVLGSYASLQAQENDQKPQSSGSKPNVLLILADDLGIGDVSAYRKADVQTPHIDALAQQGMLFTTMRANCTVCSPTRAAILTGRYADRVGVPGVIRTNAADSWGYFNPSVATLADQLRQANYHTSLIGKWHLGLTSPNTPNERGFDHFQGFLGDMMDSYWNHRRHGQNYMRLNSEVITPKGHATDLFTQWSIDYIKSRSKESKPFFLFLAYNSPHFPIEPPKEWVERVKQRQPDVENKRAQNIAFVEHMDDGVGRVMAALKESGLADNTLVIFTSDNGGSLPHAQNNDPWRDGKQSHYDGGLRVPFIVRWPAHVKAGSRSDYAGLTFDIFATALELAGEKAPADMDAVSLHSILKDGKTPAEKRDLYFVRREGNLRYGGKSYEAIIRGDWKLMQNSSFEPLELYNLKNDPQEKNNLISKEPAVVRELSAALRRQIQRGGLVPWQPPTTENTR